MVARNLPKAVAATLYFDDVSFTPGEPVAPPPPPATSGRLRGRGGRRFAPDWLESNAGARVQGDTQVFEGALAAWRCRCATRRAAAGGQSGAVYRFPDAPVDLSAYVAVSFRVYAPVAGLSARVQFNDPWTEPDLHAHVGARVEPDHLRHQPHQS